MNAALGGVSAAGIGTPELEVTQSGGGPNAFVAIQSGGSAGGVRLSKFSFIVPWCQQGIHGRGVGVGPAAAEGIDQLVIGCSRVGCCGGYPRSRPSLTTGARERNRCQQKHAS